MYIFVRTKGNKEIRHISFRIHNLKKFMGKKILENQDLKLFEKKINDLLIPLRLHVNQLDLTRIDYKLDLHLSKKERQERLRIASKWRKKYFKMIKKVFRNDDKEIETVYYKGGSFNINVYDKPLAMAKNELTYDADLTDVLRYEIQLKNKFLWTRFTDNGIERKLVNYWHDSTRDLILREILIDKFQGTGDHYNMKNVLNIFRNIKYSLKQNMVNFMKDITKSDKTYAESKLDERSIRKYEEKLKEYNVNPIATKFEMLEGLESIIKQSQELITKLQEKKIA